MLVVKVCFCMHKQGGTENMFRLMYAQDVTYVRNKEKSSTSVTT